MDSQGDRFLSRWRSRSWLLPACLLVTLILLAALAPWVSPQNPYDLASLDLRFSSLPPAWRFGPASTGSDPSPVTPRFVLGTDRQGRDLLSAILFGLRVSLLVGVSATAIGLLLGVGLGLVAGYFGGRWEAAIMRACDIQLSFPSVLIAMFLMAFWGQGLLKIIVAVGVVHWVLYARMARGQILVEREKDYIAAVRALGAGPPRIMLFHLLPNLITPILVVSVVQFASVVILEATLSFLGLGAPITRPSLGMLIKFGHDEFFSGHWWVWFFPGLTLMILMVAVNWLADALRDRFRLQQ